MPTNAEESRPHFQNLQLQFAAHLRNPTKVAYQPEGEAPIEARRLAVYEQLFFNNIESFFSQIFPVCAAILGELRWQQIVREYMVKHQARTPLFHALGAEFLDFFETEFEPIESDPDFLLELAHYEWVELALSVSTELGFADDELDSLKQMADSKSVSEAIALPQANLDAAYQLSPVAWPLAYEWPVHQLSKEFQPSEKPSQATTLLVYRRETKDDDFIEFMTLMPLLYQWLMILDVSDSARIGFETVAEPYHLPPDKLAGFAQQTLQELVDLKILRAVL
jgi:hypothetical protein